MILEKASPSDLYIIFNEDETRWKEVMFPVASRLLDVVCRHLPAPYKEQKKQLEKRGWLPISTKTLLNLLRDYEIKFKLYLLISNEHYRNKKMDKLKKKIKGNPKLTKKQKTDMVGAIPTFKEILKRAAH